MTDYLEIRQGKFTFSIPTDRLYSIEGVWALAGERTVRVGITDFVQKRGGDIAFVEVQPAGSALQRGDDMAAIETIKVNISFGSPVSGEVVETNLELEEAPEIINQDPYGKGWLAIIQAEDWSMDSLHLLTPEAYYAQVLNQLDQEAGQ